MSYFPRTVMPLTIKANAPGASGNDNSRMLASDYNIHDQEIAAIETYLGVLGTLPSLGFERDDQSQVTYSATKGPSETLFDRVATLTEWANTLVGAAGTSTNSGYALSGDKIIVPSTVQATVLVRAPSPSDTEIKANSTAGFPETGIISIINDTAVVSADSTNVEWILYGSKTADSFANCVRGYMGTTIGSHPVLVGFETRQNAKDFAVSVPWAALDVLRRRYGGYRFLTWYYLPFFELYGDLRDITTALQLGAANFHVKLDKASQSFRNTVNSVGNGLGILRQRADQSIYLESLDSNARASGILTWTEADGFIDGMLAANQIQPKRAPGSWNFRLNDVPVFGGRLSVGITTAAYTRAALSDVSGGESMLVSLGANGVVTMSNPTTKARPIQGVVGYQTWHVPSLETTATINERGST